VCPLINSRHRLHGFQRNEIASCEEAAYESLPLKDAATLLFFRTQSDLLKFAQEVLTFPLPFETFLHYFSQRSWQIDLTKGVIMFKRKTEESVEIPRQRLITASLAYARELEQIV